MKIGFNARARPPRAAHTSHLPPCVQPALPCLPCLQKGRAEAMPSPYSRFAQAANARTLLRHAGAVLILSAALLCAGADSAVGEAAWAHHTRARATYTVLCGAAVASCSVEPNNYSPPVRLPLLQHRLRRRCRQEEPAPLPAPPPRPAPSPWRPAAPSPAGQAWPKHSWEPYVNAARAWRNVPALGRRKAAQKR